LIPDQILSSLPFSRPFLFVDKIDHVDINGVSGTFRFRKDCWFYQGHFINNPVTLGVMLTECMAQIGVVSLGIFLLTQDSADASEKEQEKKLAMSSSEVDFYLPVYPGEEVKVISKKLYFRFNKLKCETEMYNASGKLVCKGKIAGMIY